MSIPLCGQCLEFGHAPGGCLAVASAPGDLPVAHYRVLWAIEWRGYFGRSGSGCHLTVQEAEHTIARKSQLLRERGLPRRGRIA